MGKDEKKFEKSSTEMKSIEAWAAELLVADWNFAAAKAIKKWGMGKEISKPDFEAAIYEAANLKCNP